LAQQVLQQISRHQAKDCFCSAPTQPDLFAACIFFKQEQQAEFTLFHTSAHHVI
jgi:hypothetical protein